MFVLPSFAGGGAERVALSLLALTDRTDFEPHLVVLDPGGPLAHLVPSDIPVRVLNKPRMRDALPKLVATVREMQPAVIFSTFTHTSVPLLAARPFLSGARLVVREANLPSSNLSRMPWPGAFRRGYRWLYPSAACVVASSARMRDELTALGVPAAKIRVLPNPVDEDRLRAAALPLMRAPGSGSRFVAAGRLTRQKGFDRLLRAMVDLPPDSQCVIFGEGPERPALEAEIERLALSGRVTLKGFVGNPAPWIAGCDGFLMPSRFEGMPNAALEALALGVPVVATPEAGGLSEIECVTLANDGSEFVAAMNRLKTRPDGLAPSLLPARFHIKSVAAEFNVLMRSVVEAPHHTA